MAAAALLRSVATKMSRAGAAPMHHRSLVARGLHGGARSGPANSNQVQVCPPCLQSGRLRPNKLYYLLLLLMHVIQQGTAEVLVSASMAAATGLRSVAGRLTTKIAHAPPPPPPYHRLVHGRRIHSRTSPDPIPSTPQKVNHSCMVLFVQFYYFTSGSISNSAMIDLCIYLYLHAFRFLILPHSIRLQLVWLTLRWLVPRFTCIFGSSQTWMR